MAGLFAACVVACFAVLLLYSQRTRDQGGDSDPGGRGWCDPGYFRYGIFCITTPSPALSTGYTAVAGHLLPTNAGLVEQSVHFQMNSNTLTATRGAVDAVMLSMRFVVPLDG